MKPFQMKNSTVMCTSVFNNILVIFSQLSTPRALAIAIELLTTDPEIWDSGPLAPSNFLKSI